jgi:hypothetical protein
MTLQLPSATATVHRLRYLVQLLGTLAILAWLPGNIGKTLAFLSWWLVTFRRLTVAEAVLYCLTCVFFTVMNALSLRQGIFAFTQPDILGMPGYELLMWGFYVLHTWRLVGGVAPRAHHPAVWLLVILYCMAFSVIPNAQLLFAVTATLLLSGLILFHEPLDLAYVGYMVFLGAAVEYTGVYSGQWHYPGNPPGGVPLWFITLWGGVGLFLRRLILSILARYSRAST